MTDTTAPPPATGDGGRGWRHRRAQEFFLTLRTVVYLPPDPPPLPGVAREHAGASVARLSPTSTPHRARDLR